MSVIRTIKDLKKVINDLPDDMVLEGYDGSGFPKLISYWLITSETLTQEEIEHGYPNGVVPTFVISTD